VSQQAALDLCDQKPKIGVSQTEAGRWDAVVFDVRGDVLVMGMGTGQVGIVGVGL